MGKGNSFSNSIKFAQSGKKPSLDEMLRVIRSQADDELKKTAEASIREQADKIPKSNYVSIYDMLHEIADDTRRPAELRDKCKVELKRMDLIMNRAFTPKGELDLMQSDLDDDDDIFDPLGRKYEYDFRRGPFYRKKKEEKGETMKGDTNSESESEGYEQ